ncbi:MAG: hypothetical protein NT018_11745 [Armatimonadetes bacterium]|nr:hypothetical protein [Armatimonadota bacterium]
MMEQLLSKLNDAGLITDQYINLNSCQMVEIGTFEAMFGAALNAEDKYEALIAADDNGNGTTKGYKRFFDAWLEAGIVEKLVV